MWIYLLTLPMQLGAEACEAHGDEVSVVKQQTLALCLLHE